MNICQEVLSRPAAQQLSEDQDRELRKRYADRDGAARRACRKAKQTVSDALAKSIQELHAVLASHDGLGSNPDGGLRPEMDHDTEQLLRTLVKFRHRLL